MEEDRAATNLGPEVDLYTPEAPPSPKQPRKRFIGRRAAAERAAAKAQENGDQDAAEDANAVAGMVAIKYRKARTDSHLQLQSQLVLLARSTKSPPKSSTTPTSMPPSHISQETTTSRFTRPSTAYVLPAQPTSHFSSQKDSSSSHP
jgi:hypothetical protein